MIVNGTLQRGRFGVAGEYGHMQVVPDGRRCECGNRGCWEQYASGNVLVREARELAAANSPVAHRILERAGGDVAAITGPLITEAARDGDPAARELFEEVGHWLGVGIANLAAALDPGTFVIGGGLSEAGDLLIGPARESFRRSLTGRRFRPEADDRAGAARQRGGPGRRRGPGPAVRPPVPPGPGPGAGPARPARAARYAVTAPLRMSNVDAAWLGMDSPDNLMMVTAVLRLEEPIDRERLEEVFAARGCSRATRSSRCGRCRRAARSSSRCGPTTRSSTSAGTSSTPAPWPTTTSLAGLVSGLLGTPLDMRHSPWQFHLVAVPAPDGSGPTSALVARLHHCIADGIALASVLLSLTDDRPGHRGRRRSRPMPPCSDPRRPGHQVPAHRRLARPASRSPGVDPLAPRTLRQAAESVRFGWRVLRTGSGAAARQPRPADPAVRPARHRQGRGLVAAAGPGSREAGRRGAGRHRQRRAARRDGRRAATALRRTR